MAHILVIDDEELLLDLISRTLRLEGHQVTALQCPLDALNRTEQVDLVLTDIQTRPISGFELVKRMNGAGLQCPALFMSGYPALTDIVMDGIGDCTLLEKPFTAKELMAAVGKVLSRGKQPRASGEKTGEAGRK